MKTVKIHFIDEYNNRVIAKPLASHVPDVGDEIRIGGVDNEKYYRVLRRVWVYDEEPGVDRVNIGLVRAYL